MNCNLQIDKESDFELFQGDTYEVEIKLQQKNDDGTIDPINISNYFVQLYLKNSLDDENEDAYFIKSFNLPNDSNTQNGQYVLSLTVAETADFDVNNYYIVIRISNDELLPTFRKTFEPKILEVKNS